MYVLSPYGRPADKVCRVQSFLASRVYLGMRMFYVPGDLSLDHDDGLAVNKTVDALPFGKIAPALVVCNLCCYLVHRAEICRYEKFLFALIAFGKCSQARLTKILTTPTFSDGNR